MFKFYFCRKQYGSTGNVPVPADYNGDRKADIAVYSPSNGNWKVKGIGTSPTLVQFRGNTDKPIPADFTGDGKADMALYSPETREWYVIRSENQTNYSIQFGASGDIPAPADFDGDGKTDLAIYRPSTSTWWYAASASSGQHRATQFGISTDKPVPNAYIR